MRTILRLVLAAGLVALAADAAQAQTSDTKGEIDGYWMASIARRLGPFQIRTLGDERYEITRMIDGLRTQDARVDDRTVGWVMSARGCAPSQCRRQTSCRRLGEGKMSCMELDIGSGQLISGFVLAKYRTCAITGTDSFGGNMIGCEQ
jgi:hypothetical protein